MIIRTSASNKGLDFDTISHEIVDNGGGTYDPVTLEPIIEVGFYVSHQGMEESMPQEDLTGDDVRDYIRRNSSSWNDPDTYFGGWIDKGRAFLDVSQHFYDKEEAISFGVSNDQLSMWESFGDGNGVEHELPSRRRRREDLDAENRED